jgi:hypothetical protein
MCVHTYSYIVFTIDQRFALFGNNMRYLFQNYKSVHKSVV